MAGTPEVTEQKLVVTVLRAEHYRRIAGGDRGGVNEASQIDMTVKRPSLLWYVPSFFGSLPSMTTHLRRPPTPRVV